METGNRFEFEIGESGCNFISIMAQAYRRRFSLRGLSRDPPALEISVLNQAAIRASTLQIACFLFPADILPNCSFHYICYWEEQTD